MSDIKKYVLAIDTATNFAGLALWGDGQILAEESWYSAMAHSIELMPRVERMLRTVGTAVQELAAIGVSLGPGSFTGLRIGLAAAKGMALPHRLPVIGIPTLDAAAFPFKMEEQPVWAVIEAGRGRLGVACYGISNQGWRQTSTPTITTVEGLGAMVTPPAMLVGEINPKAAAQLRQTLGTQVLLPSPTLRMRRPACLAEMAVDRLERGQIDDIATLAPIYLRTPSGQTEPPVDKDNSP
jgi:tRNA threonylcarbamoyladenosine biosynthesis protein TsaB